jgi:hypothetical protein
MGPPDRATAGHGDSSVTPPTAVRLTAALGGSSGNGPSLARVSCFRLLGAANVDPPKTQGELIVHNTAPGGEADKPG